MYIYVVSSQFNVIILYHSIFRNTLFRKSFVEHGLNRTLTPSIFRGTKSAEQSSSMLIYTRCDLKEYLFLLCRAVSLTAYVKLEQSLNGLHSDSEAVDSWHLSNKAKCDLLRSSFLLTTERDLHSPHISLVFFWHTVMLNNSVWGVCR